MNPIAGPTTEPNTSMNATCVRIVSAMMPTKMGEFWMFSKMLSSAIFRELISENTCITRRC